MIKIYEVMAIERGLPLFFMEHLERFQLSIGQYKDYNLKKLINISSNLILEILPIPIGKNIKLIYTREEDSFSVELIDSTKPSREVYTLGAETALYRGERKNPLIKVVNREFQNQTREYCSANNLYDVLLVNHLNEITEGSRSNFLLINSNRELLTSPKGDALEGITRKVLFRVCNKIGVTIIDKKIFQKDLESCESMIITGTSPEILPVKSCGTIKFNTNNPLIEELIRGFQLEKDLDYNLTGRYFNVKETRE